jgi:hypothetical protein
MSAVEKELRHIRLGSLFKNNLAAAEAEFKPSREMSLSRIDFHSAYNAGKMVGEDGRLLTLSEALAVVRKNPLMWSDSMGKWLGQKGFWAWFQRPPMTELGRMAALLVESSCDCLYRILNSDDPKMASAQVQASRTALELANAMPTRSLKIETLDDAVRSMTDEQKRQLIAEANAVETKFEE